MHQGLTSYLPPDATRCNLKRVDFSRLGSMPPDPPLGGPPPLKKRTTPVQSVAMGLLHYVIHVYLAYQSLLLT